MNLHELKEIILTLDNVLIISHVNPDPDTLGSALGLKWILSKLNKKARIICANEVNERICGFLEIESTLDGVTAEDIEQGSFSHIVCVDVAAEAMLGKSLEMYKDKVDLVIDHHYTNTLFAHNTYLDEKASATGEIIYELAESLALEPDRDFAKYVYCSIICDSGSFRFASTTPKTMRIAARLMETGFDFAKVNRLIFENKSLEQIAVERLAYNSLKFYCDGKIAVINITLDAKKEAGLEESDIDGVSGIPRIIAGVEVGVLIKETDTSKLEDKNRQFRISLRSNEYANVAEIAAHFGGGGHKRAAGCRFTAEADLANPAEYIEQALVKQIEQVL